VKLPAKLLTVLANALPMDPSVLPDPHATFALSPNAGYRELNPHKIRKLRGLYAGQADEVVLICGPPANDGRGADGRLCPHQLGTIDVGTTGL
jgi:hypothetical protein